MLILSNDEYRELLRVDCLREELFSIFDKSLVNRAAFRMSPGYLSLMEFEWALFMAGYVAECATLLDDGTPIIVAHRR